jgi:hypothetical protein
MDDFVDEKDNVEEDKDVYDDNEDDFNSIADKTGDFWDGKAQFLISLCSMHIKVH